MILEVLRGKITSWHVSYFSWTWQQALFHCLPGVSALRRDPLTSGLPPAQVSGNCRIVCQPFTDSKSSWTAVKEQRPLWSSVNHRAFTRGVVLSGESLNAGWGRSLVVLSGWKIRLYYLLRRQWLAEGKPSWTSVFQKNPHKSQAIMASSKCLAVLKPQKL